MEAATPKPKDVVLVIDSSGSMSQRPSFSDRQLITIAKEAAKTVVDTLNPNDKASIHNHLRVYGGGMQIARFNSYALLFLKVEKISIQNYTFLESLLYQDSTI